MKLLLLRLVLVFPLIKCGYYNVDYKFQPCDGSKEPFQVTYSERCDKACFQKCDAEPDLLDHCVNLPQYCEGFPARCGRSGCECIPSEQLPGNPYSRESFSNHVVERILCESEVIEIQVSKCAVNELGFTLGDFYINGLTNTSHIPAIDDVTLKSDVNNTCLGRMRISEIGLFYLFQIRRDLAACNGMLKIEVDSAGNEVTFYNAIKGTSRNTANQHAMYIYFSCTYEMGEYQPLGGSLRAKSHEVNVYSGNFHKDFDLNLILWEDRWQGTKYVTADKMMSQDYMYVTLDVNISETNRYNVQILQASVSYSPDPDAVDSISLITDGCANSADPYDDGVVVRSNGDSLVAEFKFRIFPFAQSTADDDEKIYLHVRAHLCDEIFEEGCLVNCKNRKRRNVELPEQHTKNVTSSPITVTKWRKTINETGHNITVMEALQYITESWEMTLMITCVLLLILTLMISMCILLVKLSSNTHPNAKDTQ